MKVVFNTLSFLLNIKCSAPIMFGVTILLPEVYPSNQQFKKHFGEFLRYGYKPHLGAIEVKFPFRDSTRTIPPHSVGLVDGFAKIVIMLSIVAMVKELELEVPRDSPLEATLHSFATVHCSYSHFQHPAHHFLYSLRSLLLETESYFFLVVIVV